MKWKPDKSYRAIGVTAFLVIAASMLFYFLLFRTRTLGDVIGKIFAVFSPIIFGFIIAYILNPQMIVVEKIIYKLMMRTKYVPGRKRKKAIRLFCALLVLFIDLMIIYGIVSSIVPELIHSIQNIILNFQDYADNVNKFINETFHNPEIDEKTSQIIETVVTNVQNWFNSVMSPRIQDLMGNVTSGVFGVVTFFKNFFIGIIISMYLLFAKEGMMARFRRFVYAFFPAEKGNRFFHSLRFADAKFGGFLIGKLIDSLIIGVICYICCLIMRMPYATLIAVVIGVTNIIPFFGPFIGAVPCAILVFVVSPIKSLVFIIFILCLQQFDGNFLGPRILGNSVGVSSYMVILSILIGGGFFGVPGMIIGVPLCAVIIAAVQTVILKKAKAKDLPGDLESYHYVKQINPITNELETTGGDEKVEGLYEKIRYKDPDMKPFEAKLESNPWDRTYEQIEEEDALINGTAKPESREEADEKQRSSV